MTACLACPILFVTCFPSDFSYFIAYHTAPCANVSCPRKQVEMVASFRSVCRDCAENKRICLLTPEGAVHVALKNNTKHSVSEDKGGDAEFVGRAKGTMGKTGEGIEDDVFQERTDARPADPSTALHPRMPTRRQHIHRAEVERHASLVVRKLSPAIHSHEFRERMKKPMVQDPEGTDRVASAKHSQGMPESMMRERARQQNLFIMMQFQVAILESNAKSKNIKINQVPSWSSASASTSLGANTQQTKREPRNQDDGNMVGVGGRHNVNRSDSQPEGQEARNNDGSHDASGTKQPRLASMVTFQGKSHAIEAFTCWNLVNGGELDTSEVRKARQLEVEILNKMQVLDECRSKSDG